MSRLEELIAELCPAGVEYKTLGELVFFMEALLVNRKMISSMEMPNS